MLVSVAISPLESAVALAPPPRIFATQLDSCVPCLLMPFELALSSLDWRHIPRVISIQCQLCVEETSADVLAYQNSEDKVGLLTNEVWKSYKER